MSYSLLPAAAAALVIACLPTVRAENCEKDVFGNEHCTNGNGPSSAVIRIIVGVAILVLVLLFVGIGSYVKRSKAKKAEALAASQPAMEYNPQGATMPSSYDPNAPAYPSYPAQAAQPYPFNGYGQNGYGQNGYNGGAPPPTYASPQGPPPV